MKKLIILLLITVTPLFNVNAATPSDSKESVYEGLSKFTKVLDLVERNYVDDVDSDQLTKSAIEGMLKNLDPYSVYLTPEKFKELEIDTYGEFGGIGVELTVKDNALTVITPIVDTPAYNAGIKPGDRIVKIEGKSTENMTTFDAAKLLRGKIGTPVKLIVKSAESDEIKEIELVRDLIKIKSVKSELIEGGIGYIKLVQFQRQSSAEFVNAYNSLVEQNKGKLNGMIVDLRNNPGGLLDEAIEIADEFIDNGIIVSVKGRNDIDTKDYFATTNRPIPDIPVIILVNKGSASASEVVAGALRDNNIARILGTQTFGKGSVQTIIELEDGSGVKLTTARFYTPKGYKINDVGISPDIIVSEDKDKDTQLNRAVEVLKHSVK